MAKTIWLHIGAQKTASALLRRSMTVEKDTLEQMGWRLVRRDEIANAPFFSHISEINAGRLDLDADIPSDVEQSLHRVIETPAPEILFMSEDLFCDLSVEAFYQNISKGLQFLKAFWAPHDLRVVLYVRAQPDYVVSCYSQLIALGRTLGFPEFVGDTVPTHLDWHHVCSSIADVLSEKNLIVRPYETIHQLGSEGYVEDFRSLLGIEGEISDEALAIGRGGARSNRGFSAEALEIARFGNGILEREDRARLRKFLQNTFSTATHSKPVFWSDQELTDMKAHYKASNQALFNRFIPSECPETLGYI